jgi:serine phosphatase RsbU (regulator of sigma subunit)
VGRGDGPLGAVGERLEQEVRERARVERELELARSIQRASLPEKVPEPEGWRINPFYRPAREVGGDFYDFHLLPEGKLGLVVGDATGTGVPAALVMANTQSVLRAVAQREGSAPDRAGGGQRGPLHVHIPPSMFVTCFYAILDPKSGHLSYANVGYDLPYLRRRSGAAEELRARGMPQGRATRRRRLSWKLAKQPSSTAMVW